jgi:hypothetical protein
MTKCVCHPILKQYTLIDWNMSQNEGVTRRVGAARKSSDHVIDQAGRASSVTTLFQPNCQRPKRRRKVSTTTPTPCGFLSRRVASLHGKSDKVKTIEAAIIAGLPLLLFILSCALVTRLNFRNEASKWPQGGWTTQKPTLRRLFQVRYDVEFDIVYKSFPATNAKSYATKNRPERMTDHQYAPDFGGFGFDLLAEGETRPILQDENLYVTDFRPPNLPQDDDVDPYYDFDDDYILGKFGLLASDDPDDTRRCRRVAAHRLHFLNCNNFHDLPMLEHEVKYLSQGMFRTVLRLRNSFGRERENLVVKDMRLQ